MINSIKKYKKNIIYILVDIVLIIVFAFNDVNCQEVETVENVAKDEVSQNLNLDEYINSLNEFVNKSGIDDFNLDELSNDLIEGKNIDFSSLALKILSLFGKEVSNVAKGCISIFIIIVIMAIIDSLQLEDKSDVTKIAKLVCFLAISTITIASFIDVISNFKQVVTTLTTTMQVVSPFLMAILIATGAITTTGIIQPLLLFLASAIGFIINYVVIPLISVSVAFNVISRISDDIKLNKMSKMFCKTSIWLIGIIFTVFLGILSLETSLSSSVDTLAVKTTQAAVSNFVPVVGKFFSDSFETVVGATKIISKVGGILGVIVVVIIAIVPIIKITAIMLFYKVLSALIEPICNDKEISEYINGFADIYQTILGILIGISILFIISIGIIINLSSQIIT